MSLVRQQLTLSIQAAVRHWARYDPTKPAIICESGVLSYADLNDRIVGLSTLVRNLGLVRQSRIGILIEDKSDYLAAVCAILNEACTSIILNITLDDSVLNNLIRDAGCEVCFADECNAKRIARFDSHIRVLPTDAQLETGKSVNPEPQPRFPDDTWGVIYSSGTTGIPKGIVRSDLSVLTELIGWCFELPINRETTLLVGRPVFYTGGLVLSTATLLAGGTVILPDEWSHNSYKSLVSRYHVDCVFLIPDQLQALLSNCMADRSKWPAPHSILTMGAPIPASSKSLVRSELGCDYIESWGNSEGLGTITAPSDAAHRPSSVGRPFIADRIRIIDDKGAVVGPNIVGRVAGISDSVLTEYNRRDDLNRELIQGELVISEDLGFLDPDGYLYLVGRSTQRILRNGTPIFANDIEGQLLKIEGIVEAAVVGIEDAAEGEVPVAAVVLVPTITWTDPLADINRFLPVHQRLSNVQIVPELPRNGAGKVDIAGVRTLFDSSTATAKSAG